MVPYLSMHLGPIWILFFELGFIRIIQILLVSISLLTMNICGFQSDLVGSYLLYIRDPMGCHWVSILDSKGSLWFPLGSCGNPCAIVVDPTGLYSAPVPQTPSSYKVLFGFESDFLYIFRVAPVVTHVFAFIKSENYQ